MDWYGRRDAVRRPFSGRTDKRAYHASEGEGVPRSVRKREEGGVSLGARRRFRLRRFYGVAARKTLRRDMLLSGAGSFHFRKFREDGFFAPKLKQGAISRLFVFAESARIHKNTPSFTWRSGSNLKRIFLLHCFYPIAFIVAVFVPNFLFQFFD